jgi:hypothetical protein
MSLEPKTFRTHKVFTKERWADDWSEQEELYCDSFTEACGTEFSHAEFHWDFGRVEGFTDEDFQTRATKDLDGQLLKVQLGGILPGDPEPRRWYGVFVADARRYGGESGLPGEPIVGQQQLRALGLEFFLERVPLDSSVAQIKDGTSAAEEVEIDRALPFNPAGGYRESRRLIGNMEPDGEEGPVFIENPDVDAFEWAGRDILDYLVGYHMPKDGDGNEQIPFSRADDGGILGAFQGSLDGLHGRSVRTVLSMLMDRRRLLSWRLVVQLDLDVETGIEITPFNFNHEDLDLPGGTTITANADTVEIDASQDSLVEECSVGGDDATRFDRVIARGERVVVCGPMDYDSGNGEFDKDWTDALQTEYNGGSTPVASFPITQQNRNQEFRANDRFLRAYRYFKVKPEELAGWLPPESVKVNEKRLRSYPPMARFLSVLPLRDGVDYTTPGPDLSSTGAPTGSRIEYIPPAAFIKDGTRYYHLDRLSRGDKLADAAQTQGRTWSASVHMRHEALGFYVNVSGGPQHLIAKTDFMPADANDTTDWLKDLDWKDLLLTVALETDNWAEAQWPDTPADAGDVVRDLILEFPGKRMEYLLTDTPFEVKADGTLKKSTSSGWILDDSEELKDLARVAYEWYKQSRRTLTLSVRTLDCPYNVGQIVTKLKRPDGTDLEEINSVITSITFDLVQGRYILRTQFAELDLRATTAPV